MAYWQSLDACGRDKWDKAAMLEPSQALGHECNGGASSGRSQPRRLSAPGLGGGRDGDSAV